MLENFVQFDEEFHSKAGLPQATCSTNAIQKWYPHLLDKFILRLGRSHNSQVWCELTRNSPHKRGSPLDTCSPKAIRCYPASPCTDNTVILLLSGTTRKNNTICRYCGLSPISWPPPPPLHVLLYSFIYMFLGFPNKNQPFLVLLTKSWTRGIWMMGCP